MNATVCIRNASWVVAWNEVAGRHGYVRDADVAFAGARLVHVGGRYAGPVGDELDGAGRMIMPGLIDVHCHPSAQAIYRGFTEEFGNPRLFNSGRQRFRQAFVPDDEGQAASAEFTLAELLAGGVTTVVDLSHAYPGWLDILVRSGIRACVAPMYRSAEWYADTGQETKYDWDEGVGWRAFEEATAIMDEADRHPCGRLSSMVSPAQVDTCTADLLCASVELAEATDRPLHVHAAQSYAEFNGMVRRHDMTPIAWLHSLGFMSPRTVIGHAVFTDEHPWLHWPSRCDLAIFAETGTSIAHCPTPFARDGTLLHSLTRYRRAGINLGIGTDTHPHNLLEEMRWAEILARVAAGPTHGLGTADILAAATVGGAAVLRRPDLGRLAPGRMADLVVVDVAHPAMRPLRDPLRSLIYGASDRAIERVIVDGRTVVDGGRVLTLDREAAAARLEAAQRRALARVTERDPDGGTIDEIMPLSLPFSG